MALLFLAGLLAVGFPAAAALSAAIGIEPGRSMERIEDRAVYLTSGPGRTTNVAEALNAYRNGRFAPEFSSASGTSAFERGLWIAVPAEYPAATQAGTIRRVIGLGGIFVVPPEVFIVRNDGAPVEVLATAADRDGQLTPRYFTYLRTRTFDLVPGDRITILIHTSQADRPTIGVFREGELGSNQIVATLIKAGFTFVLLFIGIALGIIAVMTGRSISLLLAIGFCLAMIQTDASLFTTNFVHPPWLARQMWEAITLTTAFYLYYCFLFSFRRELRLGANMALAVLTCLLPLPLIWVAYVSDSTADIMWAYYLGLFLFACTMTFKLDIAPPLRLTAGLLMVGASAGAVLIDPFYMGRSLPDLTLEFIRDLLRTMAAVGLLILLLVDVQRSRRERIEAARDRIAALEAQTESDRKLLQTERKYARAREAAARRKAQLAAASHDIRQPIVGLRSALATEAASLSVPLQSRLGEAIDYLEHLTNEYSDRTVRDTDAPAAEKEEAYPLDLITRAVGDMFGAEAEEAGIALVIDSSDCETRVPALALIRATSNLVANALRHADAKTIRLDVRHGDRCEITVSDDGKGMEPLALAALKQRGAKGEASDGDGLGLAIVEDLARRNGFEFAITSAPGIGTTATLSLKKA
ncbi:MAG: sensor histidine kinase [Novosphingobium sp.]